MNPYTGKLISQEMLEQLPVEERKPFIPVARDLTAKETSDMQIRLYAPCACGSGKKFKFCCKK